MQAAQPPPLIHVYSLPPVSEAVNHVDLIVIVLTVVTVALAALAILLAVLSLIGWKQMKASGIRAAKKAAIDHTTSYLRTEELLSSIRAIVSKEVDAAITAERIRAAFSVDESQKTAEPQVDTMEEEYPSDGGKQDPH